MYSSFYIKSLIITASAATAATRDEELSGLGAILSQQSQAYTRGVIRNYFPTPHRDADTNRVLP